MLEGFGKEVQEKPQCLRVCMTGDCCGAFDCLLPAQSGACTPLTHGEAGRRRRDQIGYLPPGLNAMD